MSQKNKFYVVWKGRTPGIYDSWDACKKEVDGFQGALYKGFPDQASAEAAFAKGFTEFEKKVDGHAPLCNDGQSPSSPFTPAIAVDAACSGNPGKMEYQGKFVDFGTNPATVVTLFKSPVFENGTNNIGEFLAIVHALAWQKQKRTQYPIYSDSVNAQKWVREKQCRTKLQPNDKNAYLFELIDRAETWLRENDNWMRENANVIPVLKWKTEVWGEIPADFGRK
ncbi:MAG: ribonuclease H family protein [Bacteroidales bacterium]|nr:ribonuclease H family protein [Bacteroidales bacterium]MBQ6101256.1 ribonuclease H family protein [Bacteroidales bacterium]